MGKELVYFGDPMCSWCWGIAPTLAEAEERYGVPLRVVVGGLRPGPMAQPLDDASKRVIQHHWHQVEERSGQPFDHSFFDREGFVYDTELACTAVVAMRRLDPKQTYPFFERLQRAFYNENTDLTDRTNYPALVADFGVDQSRFMELLDDADVREETWADFNEARRLGVSGFPTLMIKEGDLHWPVAYGFVPQDQLDALMERLAPRSQTDDPFCDIDDPNC